MKGVRIVRGERLGWWQLKRRGLLTEGSRIRIPEDSDVSYEVDTSLINITAAPTNSDFLILKIPYMDDGGDKNSVAAFQGMTYSIELPSQLMPQEPSLLPEAVVIDLDGSRIPTAWRPDAFDSAGQFSPYMDIFFSPRGNVVGTAAGSGIINLYVCDAEDSLSIKTQYLGSIADDDPAWPGPQRPGTEPNTASPLDTFEFQLRSGPFVPADATFGTWLAGTSATEPLLVKDRKIVSIVAQTGGITVSPVDGSDADGDGFADAPYSIAQSGKGAK